MLKLIYKIKLKYAKKEKCKYKYFILSKPNQK